MELRPKRPLICIYGDESSQNAHRFCVFGTLICEESCEESERKLREIRGKHYLFDEMKWTKAPKKRSNHFEGYKAVVRFYSEMPWRFKALVIDTEQYPLRHDVYTGNSAETGYYKYLFQLLQAGMKMDKKSNYDICLDPKPKEVAGNVETLERCLNGRAVIDNYPDSLGYQVCTVKEFIEPPECKVGSACLQLADLLTGMIAARWNQKVVNAVRLELIDFTERLLNVNMTRGCSPYKNPKMNIWTFKETAWIKK